MTYCLAIAVDSGLVFCSDSRTNAGVDQISTYSKMYRFGNRSGSQFVLLAAGNLATTQGVVSRLKADIREAAERNLLAMGTMNEAADYVGVLSREQQEKHGAESSAFEASFILGGQLPGERHKIRLIYPEGNYIATSADTVYLQIGESKYGKPILDRLLSPNTPLETCALAALVSMDSTCRSNLTVGPPIELLVYDKDSFSLVRHLRFKEDSEFLRELKRSWDEKLREAFKQLPPIAWAQTWERPADEQNGASR